MSTQTPSTTGDNGDRASNGKFLPGNRAARGNPHARRVARLRAAMLRAVTPEDITAIIRKLVELARGGDVAASKLLFDRCLGKSEAIDLLERIEILETTEG